MNYFRKLYYFWLICPLVLIMSLSILVIYSLDQISAQQQLIFYISGLVIIALLRNISTELFIKLRWVFYIISIILLVLVLFISADVRGSRRWIEIGNLVIQPSEFAKISIIILFSTLFSKFSNQAKDLKLVILGLIYIIPIIILVFLQPDLGTTIILAGLWIGMLFLSGASMSYFAIISIVSAVSLPIVWNILQWYQRQRVLVLFNPMIDPLGAGYNVIQAIIAVGSGQITGRGFGRGTQSHLRFLPEHQTDFIFAAFAEEWGFLGVTLLFVLYGWLLYLILTIAYKTRSQKDRLLCFGVIIVLLIHIIINIGMNLGTLPVTGIPLPFMSSGGSAAIMMCFLIGLVNNIALKNET